MSRLHKRTALAALGLCLTLSAADAQVFWRRGPQPLPPRAIADILFEEHAFRTTGRPQFAGRYYIVEGLDHRGAFVRLLVSSFSGEIVDAEVLRAPPRVANLPDRARPERDLTPPMPPVRPRALQTPPAESRQDDQRASRPPQPPARPEPLRPEAQPAMPVPAPAPQGPATLQRVPAEPDRPPPLTRPPGERPPQTTPAPQAGEARPAPAAPRPEPGGASADPAPGFPPPVEPAVPDLSGLNPPG